MGMEQNTQGEPSVELWLEAAMSRVYGLAHSLTGERA